MGRPINNNLEQESGCAPQTHLAERIVYLNSDVNEHTISQVVSSLIVLANHDSSAPITLIISTYGGSIDEMLSLYDVIKYVPCPVNTVGLGKVMSAGVLLLASGEKGNRLIGANTRVMIHPVSGGGAGNVFHVLNESKEHLRQHKLLEELICAETKISKADLEKMMLSGHDNYIVAQDAVKFGIADKVMGVTPRTKK